MLSTREGLLSRAHEESSDDENYHLILNSTWLPQLTITGLDGLPSLADASNSVKKSITMRGSLRLPPTLNSKKAEEIMNKVLLEHPD